MFSLFKEEPRKVCFTYDLFLNLEGNPPVNHLRCEKLTFNNPTIEFRYKLLMAGGVSVPLRRWMLGTRWLLGRGSHVAPDVEQLGAGGTSGSPGHVSPALAGCPRLRGTVCIRGTRQHRGTRVPRACAGALSL